MSNSFILKFANLPGELVVGHMKKISGHVRGRAFIEVIDHLSLEANPRESKVGIVTEAIHETLDKTPDLFPFKTKGVLLAVSEYTALERNRYRISTQNDKIEGILDGGHNTLAIGLYILEKAFEEQGEVMPKGIKTWEKFKSSWKDYHSVIEDYLDIIEKNNESPIDFLVPVELQVPASREDGIVVQKFRDSLFDICESRNNNVELQLSAKVNQNGYFDQLKNMMDGYNKHISDRIEWKPNAGGTVKVQDLIALSWIPLQLVDPVRDDENSDKLFDPSAVNETQMYSGKGQCLKNFNRLMGSPDVSSKSDNDYTKAVINDQVLSAFKIVAQLPTLYDYIYSRFADLYNENEGKFGSITAVKKMNEKKKSKKTPFSGEAISKDINISPDGFLIPLFYGLQALLEKKEVDGKNIIDWVVNPKSFMDKHLSNIVRQYKELFSICDYDPQKVGKAKACYSSAKMAFKAELDDELKTMSE